MPSLQTWADVGSGTLSIRDSGVRWTMLEPGTGYGFFADLAEWRVRRVSDCPRARGVDHPHRAVAIYAGDHAHVRPVLACVKVGAEEEDQVAGFRGAGAVASANSGVVLQLAGARQTDTQRAEDGLDKAAAVDAARRAAAEEVTSPEPRVGVG